MKKSIAILLVLILLFSLTACKKEEPIPSAPESSSAPEASEEVKEEEPFVKEFSDGRLYTEGDIYSFCETENYYFTLDKAEDGTYLSCFSKDGALIKRAKQTLAAITKLYPLRDDTVLYVNSSYNYIQVCAPDLEVKEVDKIRFDKNFNTGIGLLANSEGDYDVYLTGIDTVHYLFEKDSGIPKNYMPYYFSLPFGNEENYVSHTGSYCPVMGSDGSTVFIFGYRECPHESYNHATMITKTLNYEVIDAVYYKHENDPIFELVQTNGFLAYANTAIYDESGDTENRLFVLDEDLNELFTKSFIGESPVEVQAVGESLAVNIYKNGGDSSSYIQIYDNKGNELQKLEHKLSYARILSDNRGGIYLTGKQGEDCADTVIRHYNNKSELTEETVFETKNDYDKGFGLYFEINKEGKPVALQGNINNFPLKLTDQSKSVKESLALKWIAVDPFFNSCKTDLPVSEKNKLIFPGDYSSFFKDDNRYYVLSSGYLSAFDTDCNRLWCTEANIGADVIDFSDMLIALRSNEFAAYRKSDGKNLWVTKLDDRIYLNAVTGINDRLVCLFQKDPEFPGDESEGMCYIYSDGKVEFLDQPDLSETGISFAQYYLFTHREGMGQSTYATIGNTGVDETIFAKLDSDFNIISSISFPYRVEAFPRFDEENDRIYFSGQDYTRGDHYSGFIYAYDKDLNCIYRLDFEDDIGVDLIKVLSDGSAIVVTYGFSEYRQNINKKILIVDPYGNTTPLENIPSDTGLIYETETGYTTLSYNFDDMLVFTFDKDFNQTGKMQVVKDFITVDYKGNIITK